MSATVSTVLFVCTGNYYRSRFAEQLFNALATEAGLPWRAESRGLAIEFGIDNVGPMSAAATDRLEVLGFPVSQELRFPLQAVPEDFHRAVRVIALKEAEHRPLLEERFPGWADRVEYWHVHDVDGATPQDALAEIEREVRMLIKRMTQDTAGSSDPSPLQ